MDGHVLGGPQDRTEAIMAPACALLPTSHCFPQIPGKLPSTNLKVALQKTPMISRDTPGPQGVAELLGEKMIDSQHVPLPTISYDGKSRPLGSSEGSFFSLECEKHGAPQP